MKKYTIAKKITVNTDIELYLLNVSENIRHCNRMIIPQKQIEEISKYKIKQDSDKRLLARTFLYDYLLTCCDINDFELGFNQYKKPFLKAAPHIGFSFSYSKDHLLVGISKHKKIGVDIEYINLGLKLSEVAPEIMCPAEWQQFNSYPSGSPVQFYYFFNLFSAKESIIKCFGTGLYFDVKNLCIPGNTEYSYLGEKYIYHELGLWMNEYVLSLCYEK